MMRNLTQNDLPSGLFAGVPVTRVEERHMRFYWRRDVSVAVPLGLVATPQNAQSGPDTRPLGYLSFTFDGIRYLVSSDKLCSDTQQYGGFPKLELLLRDGEEPVAEREELRSHLLALPSALYRGANVLRARLVNDVCSLTARLELTGAAALRVPKDASFIDAESGSARFDYQGRKYHVLCGSAEEAQE